MKKLFKNYLQAEIDKNNKILAQNSLAEEDRLVVEEAIRSLQETMEAVDGAEESQEAIDELKNIVTQLQEGLTAVKEKINQKTEEETKIVEETTMENYLQSKNSVKDFANAIRNSKSNEEFRHNWSNFLSTNGITIEAGHEESYLPELVKGRITDIWDKESSWLKDLNLIGAKRYTVRHNISTQDAETSRAKGHKKGETKVSQSLTFSSKIVEAQFIYKIQEITVQDVWDNDEALIDYIITELVDQILYEIKRCILIGDGRDVSDVKHITSIEQIAKDTTDAYTVVNQRSADSFLVDDMRALTDAIHNDMNKDIYVFMSKKTLRELSRVQASENSTPIYLGVEQVCEQIGCSKIITTDLLGEDYEAIAFIPKEYILIGADMLSPILFTQHDIYKNMDIYRYECAVGGAIEGLKSSAVLLPAGE